MKKKAEYVGFLRIDHFQVHLSTPPLNEPSALQLLLCGNLGLQGVQTSLE